MHTNIWVKGVKQTKTIVALFVSSQKGCKIIRKLYQRNPQSSPVQMYIECCTSYLASCRNTTNVFWPGDVCKLLIVRPKLGLLLRCLLSDGIRFFLLLLKNFEAFALCWPCSIINILHLLHDCHCHDCPPPLLKQQDHRQNCVSQHSTLLQAFPPSSWRMAVGWMEFVLASNK